MFLFCVGRVIGRDGKLEPGGELVALGGNRALRTAQNSLGLGFHGGFGVSRWVWRAGVVHPGTRVTAR